MTNHHHLPRRTLTYDISCQVRNGLIQGLFITHFVISYKSANEYHFPLGQIEILCPVSTVVSIKSWSHFPNSFTETTDRSQHFSPTSFLQPNANQRARKKMESIKILVSIVVGLSRRFSFVLQFLLFPSLSSASSSCCCTSASASFDFSRTSRLPNSSNWLL